MNLLDSKVYLLLTHNGISQSGASHVFRTYIRSRFQSYTASLINTLARQISTRRGMGNFCNFNLGRLDFTHPLWRDHIPFAV